MYSLIIVIGIFFIITCILHAERTYYRNEYFKLLHKNEELAAENHHLKVKYNEIPITSYII